MERKTKLSESPRRATATKVLIAPFKTDPPMYWKVYNTRASLFILGDGLMFEVEASIGVFKLGNEQMLMTRREGRMFEVEGCKLC